MLVDLYSTYFGETDVGSVEFINMKVVHYPDHFMIVNMLMC